MKGKRECLDYARDIVDTPSRFSVSIGNSVWAKRRPMKLSAPCLIKKRGDGRNMGKYNTLLENAVASIAATFRRRVGSGLQSSPLVRNSQ